MKTGFFFGAIIGIPFFYFLRTELRYPSASLVGLTTAIILAVAWGTLRDLVFAPRQTPNRKEIVWWIIGGVLIGIADVLATVLALDLERPTAPLGVGMILIAGSFWMAFIGAIVGACFGNVISKRPKSKFILPLFSLKRLLIVVTVLCIGSGWIVMKRAEVRPQRMAAAEIEKLGGGVGFEGILPRRVVWVGFYFNRLTNTGYSRITDAGLVHLEELADLRRLTLEDPQITDAGLVHLEGLTNLSVLSLRGTQITDAGLVHVEKLTNLRNLSLGNTQVTDEGVKKLQQALPNCRINLKTMGSRSRSTTGPRIIGLPEHQGS